MSSRLSVGKHRKHDSFPPVRICSSNRDVPGLPSGLPRGGDPSRAGGVDVHIGRSHQEDLAGSRGGSRSERLLWQGISREGPQARHSLKMVTSLLDVAVRSTQRLELGLVCGQLALQPRFYIDHGILKQPFTRPNPFRRIHDPVGVTANRSFLFSLGL